MDPVIEWTQIDRILYPTCITNYLVTDLRNQFLTITVDSTVTSLTAQQLSAAGFPYCVSIHPTVTPLTPVGSLATAVGSSITLLINPGKLYIHVRQVCNTAYSEFSLNSRVSNPTKIVPQT